MLEPLKIKLPKTDILSFLHLNLPWWKEQEETQRSPKAQLPPVQERRHSHRACPVSSAKQKPQQTDLMLHK